MRGEGWLCGCVGVTFAARENTLYLWWCVGVGSMVSVWKMAATALRRVSAGDPELNLSLRATVTVADRSILGASGLNETRPLIQAADQGRHNL